MQQVLKDGYIKSNKWIELKTDLSFGEFSNDTTLSHLELYDTDQVGWGYYHLMDTILHLFVNTLKVSAPISTNGGECPHPHPPYNSSLNFDDQYTAHQIANTLEASAEHPTNDGGCPLKCWWVSPTP